MVQLPLELVNKIIMMREKHPIAEEINDLRDMYEEDTVAYYNPPEFGCWVFSRVISRQSYNFKHPVEHCYANLVIRQLEWKGYHDVYLNRNENMEIVGIYGYDVNKITGRLAEEMFRELSAE